MFSPRTRTVLFVLVVLSVALSGFAQSANSRAYRRPTISKGSPAEPLTGPAAGPYDAPCGALDFELDGDVDLEDFAEFQRVLCVP